MSVKLRFPIYVRAMAFIMLFAMFHYVAGYRLMYALGIIYAKEDAKECMTEKQNIASLHLSATEYHSIKWTEESKEFSFNNEMYDVKSIQKSGENYIITVYIDDKETGWVASLHNFEKELFHPDQSAKGTNKSAEDVMSSFQKDFTSSCEFNIQHSTFIIKFNPTVVCLSGPPLQVSDNIWHPPTC